MMELTDEMNAENEYLYSSTLFTSLSHMLFKRAVAINYTQCRTLTIARRFQPVQVLPDANIDTFRQHAFEPAIPAQLPRKTFEHLPAIKKWFMTDSKGCTGLNADHLGQYVDTTVPLELSNGDTFRRVEQPLSFFLS